MPNLSSARSHVATVPGVPTDSPLEYGLGERVRRPCARIDEHGLGGCRRRRLAPVDRRHATVRCSDQHVAATADPGRVRLGHTQHRGCNRGVDRVAAASRSSIAASVATLSTVAAAAARRSHGRLVGTGCSAANSATRRESCQRGLPFHATQLPPLGGPEPESGDGDGARLEAPGLGALDLPAKEKSSFTAVRTILDLISFVFASPRANSPRTTNARTNALAFKPPSCCCGR